MTPNLTRRYFTWRVFIAAIMLFTMDCFAQDESIHFSGGLVKVEYPSDPLACEDSLTRHSFDCLVRKLEIHVPCNYLHINYFQYSEGQIITIHYRDSSMISILCGTQADIAMQNKKTEGLHYKKVIIKGYQIIYENVPEQKLRLFNSAFELLNKDVE